MSDYLSDIEKIKELFYDKVNVGNHQYNIDDSLFPQVIVKTYTSLICLLLDLKKECDLNHYIVSADDPMYLTLGWSSLEANTYFEVKLKDAKPQIDVLKSLGVNFSDRADIAKFVKDNYMILNKLNKNKAFL